MSKIISACCLFAALFFLSAVPVHAYLDPGSGSYLIQILVASLAGAGLLVRSHWDKIKSTFSDKKDKPQKESHGK